MRSTELPGGDDSLAQYSTSNICLSSYLPISVFQPMNLSLLLSLNLSLSSLNSPSVPSSLTQSCSPSVHLLVFLCVSSFSISLTFCPSFSFPVFPPSLSLPFHISQSLAFWHLSHFQHKQHLGNRSFWAREGQGSHQKKSREAAVREGNLSCKGCWA